MGPPAVTVLLFVLLGLTDTLHHTEGSSIPDEEQDNQCSGLEKRQNLLENRLNERDSDLDKQLTVMHTQMNSLDSRLSNELSSLDQRLSTQLNTLQSEVNTRLNRMDGRLDAVDAAIFDMKDYLLSQLNAMDKKVDEALRGCEPKQDVSTVQTDTTPQENTSPRIPETTPLPHVTEVPGVYRGCEDALAHGMTTSGVYMIAPVGTNSFNVYCEQALDGGGWTVFQSRIDGTVNFDQDWHTYKVGFGQLTAEFWLGNDIIHSLTKQHDQQMKIELVSPEGQVKYANYSQFWIDDEDHKYNLTARGYSGGETPGNALRENDGSSFTTRDQDNDKFGGDCSQEYSGAWWYSYDCGYSNLNGVYGSYSSGDGINWALWKGFEVSMKATRMMFKKKY